MCFVNPILGCVVCLVSFNIKTCYLFPLWILGFLFQKGIGHRQHNITELSDTWFSFQDGVGEAVEALKQEIRLL